MGNTKKAFRIADNPIETQIAHLSKKNWTLLASCQYAELHLCTCNPVEGKSLCLFSVWESEMYSVSMAA